MNRFMKKFAFAGCFVITFAVSEADAEQSPSKEGVNLRIELRKNGAKRKAAGSRGLSGAEKALLGALKRNGDGNRKKRFTPKLENNTPAPGSNFREIKKDLPREYQIALKSFRIASYHSAYQSLYRLAHKGTADEIVRAQAHAQKSYQCSLAQLMVKCLLQEKCGTCKGSGVDLCKVCNGGGYTSGFVTHIKGGGGPTPGTRRGTHATMGIVIDGAGHRHRRVVVCRHCRGNGYDPCKQCLGTRRKFQKPSTFEAHEYGSQLLAMAGRIVNVSEESYAGTERQRPPLIIPREQAKMKSMSSEQVWLRDSANRIKSDILRLWRAEMFYRAAMRGDPELVLRSDRDLQSELSKILHRRRNLYGELGERQHLYGQNRMERLLDEMNYSDNFNGPSKPERARFQEIIGDE